MFPKLAGAAFALSLMTCGWAFPANAQSVTSQQLQSLVLDEHELQGFFRVVPKGEFLQPEIWSQQDQKWGQQEATAIPAQDYVLTNQKADCQSPFWRPLTEQSGSYSIMDRCLWSADGRYQVEMSVALCDSTATAHNELKEIRQQSQIALTPGTLSNRVQLGDESWVYPVSNEKVIRGCYGRLLYMVSGEPSQLASRAGTALEFPSEAVEAVVYQIFLRASHETALTGVSTQSAHLPKNALRIAGQAYVPVVEFEKAMGLTRH